MHHKPHKNYSCKEKDMMNNQVGSDRKIIVDPNLRRHWKNKRKLKIGIMLFILLAIIGGFFYWYEVQIADYKNEKAKEAAEAQRQAEIPKLFGKEDYKIEDRADGRYIILDKVGFSAKVPTGWRIEKNGQNKPDGTTEYWVDLLSPDADMATVLKRGCGINIIAQTNKEMFDEKINQINLLKTNPENSKKIQEGYEYTVEKINNYEAIEWISNENRILGHVISFGIPINNGVVINIGTRILPEYDTKCVPIWKSFLETINIK